MTTEELKVLLAHFAEEAGQQGNLAADDTIVDEWSTLGTLGLVKQLGAIPVIGQGKDSTCNTRLAVEL